MNRIFYLLIILSTLCSATCHEVLQDIPYSNPNSSFFETNPSYFSDGFDFPVGKPNAKGYYNAQKFLEKNSSFGNNHHLGEDWNGNGGGNTDLGDPIYACANGRVTYAENAGPGWGNVLMITHALKTDSGTIYIESLYGHMLDFNATLNSGVKRGDLVGHIGNNNGLYLAHLHFEMRDKTNMGIGGGYGLHHHGYIHPTNFINKNRPQ